MVRGSFLTTEALSACSAMSSDAHCAKGKPVNPVDYPVAWDHVPTRRAWASHMAMNVVGPIFWIAIWIALLGVSTKTPNWVVWVFMPYFIYGPYRVLVQFRYFRPALDMRRILRAYPWQIIQDVSYGLTKRPEVRGRQYGWFEFANPARLDQYLPLVFPHHLRREWWARRMAPRAKSELRSQIEVIWFAGDPRFIGLVAVPARSGEAPRHLHVIEQRTDVETGQRFADWGATSDDIERGRRAGFRPAHS